MSRVMRYTIKSSKLPSLLKAATVLSISGLAAGCSSDAVRFSDGFYTGSVPKGAATAQVPADYGQANYSPGVDPSATGSVSSQSVERSNLPRPEIAAAKTPHPVQAVGMASASLPGAAATDSIETASIPPASERFAPVTAVPAASARTKAGWSAQGGSVVSARANETVRVLAKRYGVPEQALMDVNGIRNPTENLSGQQILIPAFGRPQSKPTPANAREPVVEPSKVASLDPASGLSAARKKAIDDGGRYTVQSGDTLSAISRKTGASVASLRQVNSIKGDYIKVGQKLIVPGLSASGATRVASANVDPVVTSDKPKASDAPKVAEYTPPAPKKITQGSITTIEAQETASAPQATGVNTMRWPVQGRVVSAFGSNSGGAPNDGIDISVPGGTPVKAAENGVVIYSGDGLKELGKTILVRHADGIVTVYGHASDLKVKRGDTVKRGQEIALSGISGSAKQPQLHFEVRKNSKPVNPIGYLQ
jgi:murein DD-endopeptidase MepM/ murein hydrolase activator NlpD